MKTKMLITILFLLTIFTSGHVWAQCIQDPVGYWTLDQDTPPYLNEMVDDFHGTCTAPGCPTEDTSGHVGNFQNFDGIDDGISIADTGSAIFDRGTADSFSIAAWFRREDGSAWADNEVVVGRYAINQTHFWVGLEDTTGHAYFRLWDSITFGDLTTGFISGSADLADGQWHHIAAVRNGQTNRNVLYVDGAEVGNIPMTYTGIFTADEPMTIGRMNDNYYFIGDIDEVAYFDIALTAENVSEMFTAGSNGTPICTDNLPPQITSTAQTTATVGVEYVYTPTAEDPNDADVLTWSFLDQLAVPDGMVMDPATGAINWTPSAEMTTDLITLVVTDGLATDSEDFTITVSADGPTDPPTDDNGGGDSGGGGGCFITTILQ